MRFLRSYGQGRKKRKGRHRRNHARYSGRKKRDSKQEKREKKKREEGLSQMNMRSEKERERKRLKITTSCSSLRQGEKKRVVYRGKKRGRRGRERRHRSLRKNYWFRETEREPLSRVTEGKVRQGERRERKGMQSELLHSLNTPRTPVRKKKKKP